MSHLSPTLLRRGLLHSRCISTCSLGRVHPALHSSSARFATAHVFRTASTTTTCVQGASASDDASLFLESSLLRACSRKAWPPMLSLATTFSWHVYVPHFSGCGQVLWRDPTSGAGTILYPVMVDRGVSWEKACDLLLEAAGPFALGGAPAAKILEAGSHLSAAVRPPALSSCLQPPSAAASPMCHT